MSVALRTALFGGSFDPPHLGHQWLCWYALHGLNIDEVWVVPAFSHPFDKPLTDYAHRRAMCVLMAQLFGDRVSVLEETSRYTIDLVERVSQAYPGRRFAWLLGSDLVPTLPRWHRWNELKPSIDWIVVERMGHPVPPDSGFVPAPVPFPDVSSTAIREARRRGTPLDALVGSSVARYIEQNDLYRNLRT